MSQTSPDPPNTTPPPLFEGYDAAATAGLHPRPAAPSVDASARTAWSSPLIWALTVVCAALFFYRAELESLWHDYFGATTADVPDASDASDAQPPPLPGKVMEAAPTHVASLATSSIPRNQAPLPPPEMLEFPPNATVEYFPSVPQDQFSGHLVVVATSDPAVGYVIKVEDFATGRPLMLVYMQPTRIVRIPLPPGRYRLKFASGKGWFGKEHLFGPTTRLLQLESPIEIRGPSPGKADGPVHQLNLAGVLMGVPQSQPIPQDRF